MDANLRSARPGDGTRLAELHAELGDYYAALAPHHFRRPDVTALASDLEADIATSPAGATLVVVEHDGEIVAAAAAHIIEPGPDAEQDINVDATATKVQVDYLVTSESRRRGGLATLLVNALEEWGRAQGATLAVTSTYAGSPLSMPFWHERMGYETRSVNLRKPL